MLNEIQTERYNNGRYRGSDKFHSRPAYTAIRCQ